MAPKPNLFLIGAPKSGTTSLASYLASHPNVFFCNPKEPFFWSSDFPGLRAKEGLRNEGDYLHLFDGAKEHHTVVAEGSTTYLRSSEAVPNILRWAPDARFVALLRNPVEAIPSFHSELLYSSNETVEDFGVAWRLQEERSLGNSIPPRCKEPTWLQYRSMGMYGEQIRRLFNVVPQSQRLVLLHDDLRTDPLATYVSVLEFAGLEDDGRREFPRLKQRRQPRLRPIHDWFRSPPTWAAKPAIRVRRWISSKDSGPVGHARRLMVKRSSAESLPLETRELLSHAFNDDIVELSSLLDRDLSHWIEEI